MRIIFQRRFQIKRRRLFFLSKKPTFISVISQNVCRTTFVKVGISRERSLVWEPVCKMVRKIESRVFNWPVLTVAKSDVGDVGVVDTKTVEPQCDLTHCKMPES